MLFSPVLAHGFHGHGTVRSIARLLTRGLTERHQQLLLEEAHVISQRGLLGLLQICSHEEGGSSTLEVQDGNDVECALFLVEESSAAYLLSN